MSVPHDRVPVPPDFDEVDHGADGAHDLHAVRELIHDHVTALVALVHHTDVVPAGRQWTIPVGADCGFDGELVIRVHLEGCCERAPEAMLAKAIDIGTKLGRGR